MKTSLHEIKDLCNSHDLVFLQETRMSRAQLPTLSNINNEFVGYGLSSMKDEEQIYTGRPFGGIAVLWRKTLDEYLEETYDCDRFLGLQFTCGSFTALFYVFIYHAIAQIIMMITCFIVLIYFRLLMNFRLPIYLLWY